MALHKEKYANALLYFVSECGNEKLGVTKLNKLFYYLDFISYRDRKVTITGEKYVHLPMGPFASHLQKTILPSAEKEGLIRMEATESSKFGKRNRYQALKKFEVSVFDAYEQSLLEYLCKKFKDWSTDEMIAQTHSEAPWVFSKSNETLDFSQADDIEFFAGTQALA